MVAEGQARLEKYLESHTELSILDAASWVMTTDMQECLTQRVKAEDIYMIYINNNNQLSIGNALEIMDYIDNGGNIEIERLSRSSRPPEIISIKDHEYQLEKVIEFSQWLYNGGRKKIEAAQQEIL